MPATRLSKFDAIAPPERLQLIGLVVLARRLGQYVDQIEAAMLELTGELERDGTPSKPGDGGHTWDTVFSREGDPVRDVDEMLDKLGLPLIEPDPS